MWQNDIAPRFPFGPLDCRAGDQIDEEISQVFFLGENMAFIKQQQIASSHQDSHQFVHDSTSLIGFYLVMCILIQSRFT